MNLSPLLQWFYVVILFCSPVVMAQNIEVRAVVHESIVAFSGSEGYGRFTTGDRGGKLLIVDKLIHNQNAIGGWPVLLTKDVQLVTDQDGMPYKWELSNNLNPKDAGDAST